MSFEAEIVLLRPKLERYAKSLTRSATQADDLVQSTYLRALDKQHLFMSGTNLRAWLYRIMVNVFLSEMRKRNNAVVNATSFDREYSMGFIGGVAGSQEFAIHLQDLAKAVPKLTANQQDLLLHVAIYGESYAEAALRTGVQKGTVKTRLHRARMQLEDMHV